MSALAWKNCTCEGKDVCPEIVYINGYCKNSKHRQKVVGESMVGDVYIDEEGHEMVVVWNGEEGLIGPRETKPVGWWQPPKRQYNKKDTSYWNADGSIKRESERQVVDKEEEIQQDSDPNLVSMECEA